MPPLVRCQIFLFTPNSCHWDSNIKNLTSCHYDLTKYLQNYMYVTKYMIIFSFYDFLGSFSENQSQWTRQPTLLLIYENERNKRQMDEGKLRKNSFWTLVTKKLQEEGYNFTQEQISGRWKTLCRNYKSVKDGNKKSGILLLSSRSMP